MTLANLERVGAKLIGWDHWTDLAVLRIDLDEVTETYVREPAPEDFDIASGHIAKILGSIMTA